MSKLLSYGLILVLCSILSVSVSAQTDNYQPDTTLGYDVFLDQCINFKSMDRQEVWVVFFWASWDSRSLFEIDPLKSTYNLFKNKPVRFVGVSVDKIRSRWETALMREKMPWEHLMIARTNDYEFIKKAFRHNSLPGIFLVNSQGTIRRMTDGEQLRSELFIATRFLPDEPYKKPASSLPSNDAIIEDMAEVAERENVVIVQPVDPTPETEPDPQRPPRSEPKWLTHKVKRGDTLFSLYRRYGVSVSEIKRINGLRSNTIKIGQELRIKLVDG